MFDLKWIVPGFDVYTMYIQLQILDGHIACHVMRVLLYNKHLVRSSQRV